jgi:hypothetical protein
MEGEMRVIPWKTESISARGPATAAPVDRMESVTGSAGPALVKAVGDVDVLGMGARTAEAPVRATTWTEGSAKRLAGRDAVAMEERGREAFSGRCRGARVAGLQPCKQPPFGKPFEVGISPYIALLPA